MPSVTVVETLLTELMALAKANKSIVGRHPAPNLTPATAFVLSLLVRTGEHRCGEVAELMSVDPSVVSRQLAELERHGLTGRRADPQDGRASLFFATAAGRALLAELREEHVRAATGKLADWSDDDLHRLITTLRRLSADLHGVRSTDTGHHVTPATPAGRKVLA